MNIKNIHLAYFSATFSTKRIVREIASQFRSLSLSMTLPQTC